MRKVGHRTGCYFSWYKYFTVQQCSYGRISVNFINELKGQEISKLLTEFQLLQHILLSSSVHCTNKLQRSARCGRICGPTREWCFEMAVKRSQRQKHLHFTVRSCEIITTYTYLRKIKKSAVKVIYRDRRRNLQSRNNIFYLRKKTSGVCTQQ
jgi:hypothetical protein